MRRRAYHAWLVLTGKAVIRTEPPPRREFGGIPVVVDVRCETPCVGDLRAIADGIAWRIRTGA